MSNEEVLYPLRNAVKAFKEQVGELREDLFLTPMDGWSARDVVAHLIGWSGEMITASESILHGETPAYYADVPDDYKNINAGFVAAYPPRSKSEMLTELDASMAKFEAYILARAPGEMEASHGIVHFSGRPATIAGIIASLTGDYQHHQRQISAWLAKRGEGRQTATLAGGCFWCLEAVFEQLKGVEKVVSGYAGGNGENPSYREVCSGATGHAEVVQVTYNPAQISYRDLLGVFFSMHDPTTLNRQGADVGTQYRSAIFYNDDEQKATAEAMVRELTAAGLWARPVVTELSAYTKFYPAEDYHQEYFRNNSYQPYCQAVIAPKVARFRKQYLDRLKV